MGFRVLVIEDNTDCRELFAMMVRHLGCEVLQADDGELGVQKALSEKPDLIFMDISMPNMNGMDAISCLRGSAVTKNTPIVIYTAWMDEIRRARRLNAAPMRSSLSRFPSTSYKGFSCAISRLPEHPPKYSSERPRRRSSADFDLRESFV